MNLNAHALPILAVSAAVLFAGFATVQAVEDGQPPVEIITGPVQKRWTEEVNGKTAVYMTLDGVLVHETDTTKQPLPPVVTPPTPSTQDKPGDAPSDAVVLFDGTQASMDNWLSTRGNQPNGWKLLDDGSMEIVSKTGSIKTKDAFGSCHLHIEWLQPDLGNRSGQDRGNSGVFLMDNYEVQVLDSYNNVSTTYADGQAGALYGRSKPAFNACRAPGQWQTYDILFTRPLFDEQGNVTRRAHFVVMHNGIYIQNTTLFGNTGWDGPHAATDYKKHADKLPLQLQAHGSPVRYRNIWIRPLED